MESIAIDQLIRSRRRTLALQITPDAQLVVRAPLQATTEFIHRVIRDKLDWIHRRQRLAKETVRLKPKHQFSEGESFHYLGEPHQLSLLPDSHQSLEFNDPGFSLGILRHGQALPQFFNWYRRQSRQVLEARVQHYAAQAGLWPNQIKISSATSRWGSCSSKGRLNFSWRLIMAPLWVVDYVVVHELVHLAEPNHSPRFWERVRLLYPQSREAKTWLKTNHQRLTLS